MTMQTGKHATGSSWLLPVSALFLLGGMIFANHAVGQRQETRQALAETRSLLTEARQTAELQQQRKALQQEVDRLQERTRSAGLTPAYWGQRQLDYSRSSMNRRSVNRILAMLENTPEQWVDIDRFELSVVKPDMGLFRQPVVSGSRDLVLSVTGMKYFSLQEVQP